MHDGRSGSTGLTLPVRATLRGAGQPTNTTRDGFVVSDGSYNFGAFSATYTSPDLVEEVRIITAPVDAEGHAAPGRCRW